MKALEDLFTVFPNTMSVHLREKLTPMAKHGSPGEWHLEPLNEEILTKKNLVDLADDILDRASYQDNAFIEEDSDEIQIVQLENYRIVITCPPFSDAHEITIVKPTMQRALKEYLLPQKVLTRLQDRAEGILIAGAPGHGKSTFASALTRFYADQNKIIKTIEKPRDLQLDERVTQFTTLEGDIEKVGDVLLLMRPDYVIFDEIRKNTDFIVYTDMRLAGVGMVGVIHATQPIDAIQRFVNRVELGLIPSVIDTVLFIHNGEVADILSLKIVVKTPTGFRDESLARPVIEVRDYIDGVPLFEMFSFGEQIVVIPLQNSNYKRKNKSNKSHNRNYQKKKNAGNTNYNSQQSSLKEILSTFVDLVHELDLVDTHIEKGGDNTADIYMPEWAIDELFNHNKDIIQRLEQGSGLFFNFIATDRDLEYSGTQIEIIENKKYLILKLGSQFSNQNVQLLIGPQVIMTAPVDKLGNVKLSRQKANTKRLEKLLDTADTPLTVKAM